MPADQSSTHVTVIATMRNEAETIRPFLQALSRQTLRPQAVILVDGGSTDGTLDQIDPRSIGDLAVTVSVIPGANRSVGRNAAIRQATTPLIACTDIGSLPEPQWLEALVRPFHANGEVDVVAGFYKPTAPRTRIQGAMAALVCPRADEVDRATWLPSARSLGLRRAVWEEVGGFPEEYSHNEDTPFALRLRQAGFRVEFAPDAVVRWSPQPTAARLWRQYFRYGRGDGQALIFPVRHAVFALPWLAPIAALLGSRRRHSIVVSSMGMAVLAGYVSIRTIKAWGRLVSRSSGPTIPVALAILDLASASGYVRGIIDRV